MGVTGNKTVFLDRDGTINVEKNYLFKTEDFEFIKGSDRAIKLLNDHGYKVVVITNQAGVARGFYSEKEVNKLHKYINQKLEQIGAHIDGFYFCPHHPVAGIGFYKRICNCRKPNTGLFEKAAQDFNVDTGHSYMIGDNIADIQAGNNFGVRTILVSTGYGKKLRDEGGVKYDYYTANLLSAVEYILERDREESDTKAVADTGNTNAHKYKINNGRILDELEERYPALGSCREDIYQSYCLLRDMYRKGGKLLIAGNGGSAADAEHIVGELMKGFVKKRKPEKEFCQKLCGIDGEYGKELAEKLQGSLPAIALSAQEAIATAYLNDVDGQFIYAQMVNGYGTSEDIFLGISTSGNSKNVLLAAVPAKAQGMKVIALTGKNGGKLEKYGDIVIRVPEEETFKVQELHLPVYHALCRMLEETFFQH